MVTDKKAKEEEKLPHKCAHAGCSDNAIYKGTVTKKDIESIKEDKQNIRHLFQVGAWYYCQKHKDIIGACATHMKFESI